MIVAVAGLPAMHYNAIQKQVGAIFGTGQRFIGEPLRPNSAGEYQPDLAHGEALLARLTKALKTDTSLNEHGCGVIIVGPEGYDATELANLLAPFAVLCEMALPLPVKAQGRAARMQVNQIASGLRRATPPLVRAVNAMNTELKSRLNRTPLLLPLRNFAGRGVADVIRRLSFDLPLADSPEEVIVSACKAIEARYPFGKVDGGSTKCFTDDRNIQFRLPARAHHGMAGSSDPPHNPACFLNGGFRIGGRYEPGFHYDCRRDHSSGQRKNARPLKGTFPDCHGDHASYKGKPHLNIAPNDFARE